MAAYLRSKTVELGVNEFAHLLTGSDKWKLILQLITCLLSSQYDMVQ